MSLTTGSKRGSCIFVGSSVGVKSPSQPGSSIIRSALPTGPVPGTSSDSVIEAGSVTVLPDGSLLPGPDAQLVLTPTLSDASIQDVTVSSGSLFSMVLAAGGVFLAWKFLSKRGKV